MELLDFWRQLAACRPLEPNPITTGAFYPSRGEQPASPLQELEDASVKATCWACPVEFVCLDQAMTEMFGVWGGMPAENRSIIRRNDHECPWCGATIAKGQPSVFCPRPAEGPWCLEEATYAEGEELEMVIKRLRALDEWASWVNWDRRQDHDGEESDDALCA